MRIVVATRHLGFAGGVETHLQAVLPLLHARGHALAVLHEHPSPAGAPTLVEDVPDVPRILADQRPVPSIVNDVAAFRPDLVYNHGLDSPRLESALARRFQTVLYAHNYYGICISGTRSHAGATTTVPCQRAFGAACLAVYLPKHCGGNNPLTMLRLYRTESLRHRSLRHYAAVLVASRYVARQFERCGVEPAKIHHVPLFPPRITPASSPPPPRPMNGKILFLGRITPQKGLPHLTAALIEAQRRLGRPLHLQVAGDGPGRDTTLDAARREGLSVETLGWIDAPRRNQCMSESDLLAVPSLWPEPFGLVGLEAACVGLPSVAYASGGIPEWLLPGVSGELASDSPPHPHSLARAVVRALENPLHWQALREGAWKHSHVWTPDAHITRLLAVVQTLAPSHV